jgi:hypothetical protein
MTGEEYTSLLEEDNKKEYLIVDNTRYCRKCGEMIFTVMLEYRLAAYMHLSSIPSLKQCQEEDDIAERPVRFCVFCDGWPDLETLPIALFGSFHNRPH